MYRRRFCSFQMAWKNRTIDKYGKQKVFFIGLTELIKNKKAVDRQQDSADLDKLLKRLAKLKRK